MAVGRYWMDPRRIGQLVGDYLARDPLRLVAARCGRSVTWLRDTFKRLALPGRNRGGLSESVSTEEIVRLRDKCLSWAEVHPITAHHRNAHTSGQFARTSSRFATSTSEEIRRRNDAVNHLDEIRAAYWSGATLEDLADQWGVSLKTITIWVYTT